MPLGVDGTAHGERQRARFFGRNADVPLMVIAVGDGAPIAAALPELGAMLARPLSTLERVRVCKRDGERARTSRTRCPRPTPRACGSGRSSWSTPPSSPATTAHPLYDRARAHGSASAGAAGATSLRGIWGYHGDHAPHGDSVWQLRRRVPVLTVIVDTPERIRRWFALIDELTTETGLVTSESSHRTSAPPPRWRG